MHRLTLITLVIIMCAASACSTTAPVNEMTPEAAPTIRPELTPEITAEASSVVWERYIQADASAPGWVLQHPEGWTVVNVDAQNVFLYSAADAGDRLFINGLQPGEFVFQFSFNRGKSPDETPTDHLSALSQGLYTAIFGEIEPVTIAGLEGVQRRGTIEDLGLSITISSRPFSGRQFIDIIAYSRIDEFERNLPMMDAVIETVRYVLPRE